MRPHPRMAETDPSSPRAWATCDRCGFVTNLYKLSWQLDWRGAKLDNTRILVCSPCYDDPQRQLGVIFIPPDPMPKLNARVEAYTADEQPVSTRYTMNGIARAVRYQPYPVLRIVNGQGNVPATVLAPLPTPVAFNWVSGGIQINGAAASTTCTITLSRSVDIGNLLCISFSFAGLITDSITVSDDKANTYTAVDSVSDGGGYIMHTFYIANVINAPKVITATNSTSARSFATMIIDEFSNGRSVALDGHSIQAQSFPTGLNGVSSGNYTTSKNGDLIWGCLINVPSFGISSGTSFNIGAADNVIGSFVSEYKIQSIAGQIAATATANSANTTVSASMAFSYS